MRRRKVFPRPRRRDRPKAFKGFRRWLVKFRDVEEPVPVVAEHRGAARHYAKCVVDQRFHDKGEHYPLVEWCRLDRRPPRSETEEPA